MIVQVQLPDASYDVVIEHGCLARAEELLQLDRRVMIVTDTGVPVQYAETVAALASENFRFRHIFLRPCLMQ